jgi:hypothetical protein
MRTTLRFVGLIAILAVVLSAAEVTGTWKGSFDFNGTAVPLTFNLKAASDGLTGNIEGLPNTPTEIHDGKLDGDTITFWINTDYQGQTYKLVYKGKVAGDEIKFTFGTEDGSWGAEVTAKKSS